ncbi:hypothetical protein I546_2762 [Mycobacterium kansasii 732]|nr:hypothetical protein I546_2762 [Mycobacterium kansasii 732]
MPRLGNPASLTAAAAVVPAGTRIGACDAPDGREPGAAGCAASPPSAPGTGCAGALIGLGLQGLDMFDACQDDRDHAIGAPDYQPKPIRHLD